MLHVTVAFVALHPFILVMLPQEPDTPAKPVVEKKKEVIIALVRPAPIIPMVTAPTPMNPQPTENSSEMAKKELEKTEPKEFEKEEVVKKEPIKEVPKYTRTSDEQLQGEPDKAVLQGERSTIAASSAAAKVNAPDRASVTGDSKYKDRDELVDTTYQDGALEHMNKGADGKPTQDQATPPTPKSSPMKPKFADQPDLPEPDPNKVADQEVKEKKSSIEETPERGEAMDKGELATTDKNVDKFLETDDKSLDKADEVMKNLADEKKDGLASEEKTIANKKVDPDAMKEKAEEEKRKKQREASKKSSQPKTASNKTKKGFRSEAKATVVEGSLFRRSKKGSANVKATPLGKYMATISKLVEQEWQRRCMMHADLIQPGSVRMSFIVMPNGKVKHTRTLSRQSGSEAQFNLTYQAINSVKLPPMPASVKKIQEGDPIEFRYSFSF